MTLSVPRWMNWHAPMNGKHTAAPAARWSQVHAARRAIREGRFDDARDLVTQHGDVTPADAPCLNLLGVVEMSQHNWKEAVKLWRCSIHADRTYRPPRRNLRRYFELFQFGHSHVAVALGDEPESFIKSDDEP